MPRFTTKNGATITTDKQLGSGGEGAVYTVAGQPHTVAKIYHPHRLSDALADKVETMVANPPDDEARRSLKHVSIAWPEQILMSGGKFVGYLMPKIPKSDDLYDLLQPQQRAKQHPHADHRMIFRTARNFATAVAAIHRKNYVLGDVNFKNALFTDQALITIVDCDSMQVTDAHGTVHRCLVGLPEYTAPELQGADFAKVNRTTDSDVFGLAVLIFQLLMQGFHPFAGRPLPGAPDVEQVHVYCIAHTIFPYEQNTQFEPPKAAPAITALPGNLRTLFQRAFTERKRPSAQEWADALAMVEQRLIQCSVDSNHWYPADGACVICEVDFNSGRRKRTTPAPTTQMQVPLTPNVPPSNMPAPARSTFTLPTTPTISVPPSTRTTPSQSTGSLPRASVQTYLTNMFPNRMVRVAVGVIVVCMMIIVTMWSGSSGASTSDIIATTTVERAPVRVVATATPATATLIPTANIVRPACTQTALLAQIWADSYAPLWPMMQVNGWPQTVSAQYGTVLTIPTITAPSSLVHVGTTLTDALACQGGTLTRMSVDDVTHGAGLGCDETLCSTSTPLFREYSGLLYGENTPSQNNFVAGKLPIARFFAVTGSKARYTGIIVDASPSDYQLFAHYQLPLVQREFMAAKDSELTQTTVANAPVWYDVWQGRQTEPSAALLSQWQRTITIPTGIMWSTGNAVQARDYTQWFSACADTPLEVVPCHYIADVNALNNRQLLVTYIPGVPRDIARIIQPWALPPNAPNNDISAATTMLSDSMTDWMCTPRASDNTWRCETQAQGSSSDVKIATFYRYRSMAEFKDALATPFDIALISADLTPAFAAEMALHPIERQYTLEFVPTGALYAVTPN